MSIKMSPAQQLARQLKAREAGDEDKVLLNCKIKDLREEAGLTQSDVARAVGTNASAIGHIEKGNPPRLDVALRLAAFFACSVESIWQEADPADASDEYANTKD